MQLLWRDALLWKAMEHMDLTEGRRGRVMREEEREMGG